MINPEYEGDSLVTFNNGAVFLVPACTSLASPDRHYVEVVVGGHRDCLCDPDPHTKLPPHVTLLVPQPLNGL